MSEAQETQLPTADDRFKRLTLLRRGFTYESLASRLKGLFGREEGFLGVPLVAQGRVIGLLAVMRKNNREMSADDEWLLSALPDQMAGPVGNAPRHCRIRRAARDGSSRAAHAGTEGGPSTHRAESARPSRTDQRRSELRQARGGARRVRALQRTAARVSCVHGSARAAAAARALPALQLSSRSC